MPHPFRPVLPPVTPVLFLAVLFCLAALVPAGAQETIATSPLLPHGYTSIKVFDRQGRFVGRLLPDKRYWVTIDRIPAFLQKAVVAVEDARFYEHAGIDIRGIARALVKDVVKRQLAEGGSTITQQLIKNRYLSSEKSIERKLEEARLALEFEKKYTKRQILEMYFNEIYYGNGAWGIAQAARLYFDKNPEELTEAECALLAGVQKNPARYNPLGKPAQVLARRDLVLKRMQELSIITPQQRQRLRTSPPAVVQPPRTSYVLPLVRSKLLERYGSDVIDRGGLEVTTAFDLTLQIQAERTVTEGVTRLNPRLQGALVSLDAATGDILAVAGGIDGTRSSYNRAVAARRQPGSAIKPFIYAAALEQGMVTAATIRDDAPRAYKSGTGTLWTPHNYGDEQYGPLSLRQALAYSSNTIAVGLLEELGVGPFVDFARTMGLDLPLQNGLSLALGTGEAPPLGLVAAYASLANGGLHPEPRCIIRVYDRTRNLWTENPAVTTPVLSAGTSFIITQMLKDVLTSGTAKSLKGFSQKHPCAGKTGTTDDYRDAWFIGYTPRIVTGVWVGYDQPRSGGRGFTGGVVAAPIWERFMRKAVALFPADDFAQPDTVITVSIDPATGQLATATCPTRRDEFFRAGTEPHELCHLHPDTTAAPPPAVVP